MPTLKLSRKHQIVVPKSIREKLALKAGMLLRMLPLDEHRAVLIKEPKNYVEALEGLGKEVWKALGGADKYIKAERLSWQK